MQNDVVSGSAATIAQRQAGRQVLVCVCVCIECVGREGHDAQVLRAYAHRSSCPLAL
jgi:hypothetical protein